MKNEIKNSLLESTLEDIFSQDNLRKKNTLSLSTREDMFKGKNKKKFNLKKK